ncbi:7322_t:CDS:1, partial [Ambispora gerdemannii]
YLLMDSDDNKTLLNKQSLPSSTPHTPTSASQSHLPLTPHTPASQSHPPPTSHTPASQSHPSPTSHTPASQSHPPPTPHTSTSPKKSQTYEDYSSDDQCSNLRTIQQRFEMSQKNKEKTRIRVGSLSSTRCLPTRCSPSRRSPSRYYLLLRHYSPSRRSPSPPRCSPLSPRHLPLRISNPFLVDDLQITTYQT